MDDMKDKVKGFMKKVNNPFSSSSSGKFKGQGRVLGSASSSSEPINPVYYRPSTAATPRPNPSPPRPSNDSCKAAQPRKPDVLDRPKPESPKNQETKSANGFDPFDSLITSGKRSQNGYSLNLVECPICNRHFSSEEEVSEHVDHCTVNDSIENQYETGGLKLSIGDSEERSQLEELVRMYLSAKPTESSVEILIKLLRNIAREPDNVKFRRIRMANPKIEEAVGEVAGGVQLLESVGFELREESGEMWMVMEVPGKEGLGLISKAVALLEPKKIGVEEGKKIEDVASSKVANEVVEPTKIDRQVSLIFLHCSEFDILVGFGNS